jgi:MoxR-like ATPase
VDEIEKAAPQFVMVFLQVLDDGRLTDGQGETVVFIVCSPHLILRFLNVTFARIFETQSLS